MTLFNVPEFSVSEFSASLKRLVEDSFGYVRIRGEVSGFKKAASGHWYFSLKDERALIGGVCFRDVASRVDFEVEDGILIGHSMGGFLSLVFLLNHFEVAEDRLKHAILLAAHAGQVTENAPQNKMQIPLIETCRKTAIVV